ncbi:MFS transporter [Sciscionella marina]|uniref:MFS transporter n=1 Tax=Sciscionella marina TaxID=508770 RepID=UPI0003A700A0|nr:MFS transporter [Sciscionella marina]
MRNRWLMLGLGWFAQVGSCSFLYGMPSLIPALRSQEGLALSGAGVVAAAPLVGLTIGLIPWGAVVDRFGERYPLALGLGVSGLLVLYVAAAVHGLTALTVLLGVAGAAAASVNAASGKLVLGWFAAAERGRAMALRQTAQPVGAALASLGLPMLGAAWGFRLALVFPAFFSVLGAAFVAVFARDPARPVGAQRARRSRSPYRGSPVLARLHAASTLLVVPQFAISAFALEYLVREHGWAPQFAGVVVAGFQLAGAFGRIGAGWWSDLAGSRLRPMRLLAVASAGVLLLFALGDAWTPWLAILALGLGAVLTVADNGLAFASVAELAGPDWAGRALGTQNAAQNVSAALTPPLLGALIGATGYGTAFVIATVFPLLAIVVTPVSGERMTAGPEPVSGRSGTG